MWKIDGLFAFFTSRKKWTGDVIQIVVYPTVNYRPAADAMLRIAGNGLPHQISGLVRNDIVFDGRCTYFGAEIFQVSMSLRASAHTGVAIRFLGIRKDAIVPTER